jgi:Family of unknown function (DUF6399)
LTAVPNFEVEGSDGTTAAERLFGAKPEPVFAWLLERMPELPRPAQKRPSATERAAPAAEGWPNGRSQPTAAVIVHSANNYLEGARY